MSEKLEESILNLGYFLASCENDKPACADLAKSSKSLGGSMVTCESLSGG